MGSAVYEHVVIVLTHGSRLTAQELEESIRRMTTKFIPYLRNTLRCKVREEALIFKKGYKDDGLDSVLNYIIANKKYKPKVMKDIGKYWNPKDPATSIEFLLKNSLTFAKIQGLLLEVQDKNEDLQGQLKQIKHEMKHANKETIRRLAHSVNTKIRAEKETVDTLREEMETQMKSMQQKINEKNQQIDILWKELHEFKSNTKLCDSLTTRTTETDKLEGRYWCRDYSKDIQYYSKQDLSNARVPSALARDRVNTNMLVHTDNSKFDKCKPLPSNNPNKDLEKKRVEKQVMNEKYYMNPAYVSRFNRQPVYNTAHYIDIKNLNTANERKGLIDVKNSQSKLKKTPQGISMKLVKEYPHCIFK
jgi:hypothetical protein